MHGRIGVLFVVVGVALVAFALPAAAQTDPLYPSPTPPSVVVSPERVAQPAPAAQAAPAVQAAPVAQVKSGGLPVTGGDVLGLAAIGAVALGAGLVMVRFRSARRSSR